MPSLHTTASEVQTKSSGLAGIETRSIDYVPENERHGRVADQGPFWFLGNFQFFTIAIGFVGPSMGLSLGYTAVAAIIGILFGTLFMAFHASQGAELGLPQMIQSRAQFGYRGVTLVLIGTLVTFIGFNVVDTVLLAAGLNGIFGWNITLITLVIAVISALFAIYGHDCLHTIFKICFYISLPLYIILTGAILTGHAGGSSPTIIGFSWVAFVGQIAASASYNITYAPYVSDYSRYLPRNTRPISIIMAVMVGASSSAIWLIILGAWLATRLGASDGLVALHAAGNAVFPGFGSVVALASVIALVATMGLNAYSCMLTILTGIDSFRPLNPTRKARILTIIGIAALWTGVSLQCPSDAIGLLFATLTVMLYLLVPWTAVNLVDYFLVRKGHYAITNLFMPGGGIYGMWQPRGLLAYAIGFLSTIPFAVLPGIYTGPIAHMLGDVDVGWLVGLVVSGGVYALLSRSLDLKAEETAITLSEADLKTMHGTAPGEATAVPAMDDVWK
ncbi:purine-cytosine permease family protein [Acetobacter conturbans]|uniref:Allantoin permease n=1 Tax=Acetobacter conturbans TaxID=1737472 RepID=A0ABX0K5A9_9PROT|nr:cytosine permease [Acetobacter conturbans]NHN89345.1 allantoin permease [Acetobacter conturbans]